MIPSSAYPYDDAGEAPVLTDFLPDPVVEVLVQAESILHEVYERNRSDYEPELGDDPIKFGFDVYRNWWNRLSHEFTDVEGVRVEWPDNSLQLCVAGFTLHFWSGRDHGSMRFDVGRTKPRVVAENSDQLKLWEDSPATRTWARSPTHVVMVHEGRPSGLRSVSVGAPRGLEQDATLWDWRVVTFRAADAVHAPDDVAPQSASEAFDERPAPEPTIELRPRDSEAASAS